MNENKLIAFLWAGVVLLGAWVTAYAHGYHLLAAGVLVPVGLWSAYTLYGAAHGAAIVARQATNDIRSALGTATPPYRGDWR